METLKALSRLSRVGTSMSVSTLCRLENGSAFSWLAAYFVTNLALTIYNKLVLAGNFPFPYSLTAIHCLFGTVGSYLCLRGGVFKTVKLTYRDTARVSVFSVLYTVNIVVSNLSLLLVTVPFHQIVRSTTPLFVVAISVSFFKKSFTSETYLSLIPVIFGVALATAGDYYFTTLGFLLTLLGTLLAALKTILTNQLQKCISSPMHQLDVLLRMSPLACIQSLMYGTAFGEIQNIRNLLATLSLSARLLLVTKLSLNGVLAFVLNYSSFTANNKTSPLTMTVAANIKQCLSIVLGVWIFRLQVGWMNAIGIIIALVGGAWYASVELSNKCLRAQKKERAGLVVSIGTEKLTEKEMP